MVKVIVGEMVNIESGKYLYDDGELIKRPAGEKPPSYPSIECNGTTTTFKSNIGIIYLPLSRSEELNSFAQVLKIEIDKMDKKHKHLTGFARVERYAGHFTAMKAKPNYANSTLVVESGKMDNPAGYLRMIDVNTSASSLNSRMGKNRFNWFIFPQMLVLKNLQNFENPRFSPLTQFISIYYDQQDLLMAPHNTKLEDNITLEHFRVCQNLMTFKVLETVVKESKPAKKKEFTPKQLADRKKLRDNLQCPDCKRKLKSKGAVTRHMNSKACITVQAAAKPKKTLPQVKCPACSVNCGGHSSLLGHITNCWKVKKMTTKLNMAPYIQRAGKEALEKFKDMDHAEKKARLLELSRYPEYLSQWNDIVYDEQNGIKFCRKRGTAFEIMAYFGDFEGSVGMNLSDNNVPIYRFPDSTPVYEEDFKNIIVDNEMHSTSIDGRMAQLPNLSRFNRDEVCVVCLTPLYDEVYGVIPVRSKIHAYMVCPTCMHYNDEFNASGTTNTILRVKYPVSRESIVKQMKIPDQKKRVLMNATSDSYRDGNALYLDYTPGGKFKHIGWPLHLIELIRYAESDAGIYKTGDVEKIKLMMQEAQIFPVQYITHHQ